MVSPNRQLFLNTLLLRRWLARKHSLNFFLRAANREIEGTAGMTDDPYYVSVIGPLNFLDEDSR